MVNERVGAGEWEEADELGETWRGRNAFSFGRGEERRGSELGLRYLRSYYRLPHVLYRRSIRLNTV